MLRIIGRSTLSEHLWWSQNRKPSGKSLPRRTDPAALPGRLAGKIEILEVIVSSVTSPTDWEHLGDLPGYACSCGMVSSVTRLSRTADREIQSPSV